MAGVERSSVIPVCFNKHILGNYFKRVVGRQQSNNNKNNQVFIYIYIYIYIYVCVCACVRVRASQASLSRKVTGNVPRGEKLLSTGPVI
jgi:hypothetical protein